MTVLIAGGTGLIGNRLTELLVAAGNTVHVLSRQKRADQPKVKYFLWDVGKQIDEQCFYDTETKNVVDAIINLTGEGIADKRWSSKRKEAIIDSRVAPAKYIQLVMSNLQLSVPVYVSASGVNYYNNSEKKKYVESDDVGDNFVQHVCELWEKQALKMNNVAERVCIARTGVVLAKRKSFLQKFTATTKIGVAGIFGSGKQFLSWIHIDDLCHFYMTALKNGEMIGAYNAGISNQESHLSFIKSYRTATKKKFIIVKAPVFVAKLVFGEMSTLLTDGVAVSHQKMVDAGVKLEFETVESAIKNLLTE